MTEEMGSSQSQPIGPAPIHLNLLDVARAAKAAYDEGRLSAQGSTPESAYRDESGQPCAIGAALTDEQVEIVYRAPCEAVAALIADGVVTTDDPDALCDIQGYHDSWAMAAQLHDGGGEEEVEFVGLLNSILAAAPQETPQAERANSRDASQ